MLCAIFLLLNCVFPNHTKTYMFSMSLCVCLIVYIECILLPCHGSQTAANTFTFGEQCVSAKCLY